MPGDTKPFTEFGARIPTEMYEEFNRYFPQYGAATWFIRSSLNALLEKVRKDGDAQARVRAMIEEMVRNNREDNGEGEAA